MHNFHDGGVVDKCFVFDPLLDYTIVNFRIPRGDKINSSSGLFGEDSGKAVAKVLVFIKAFIFASIFVGKGLGKDRFPVVPSKLVGRSRIPDLGEEYRFVCVQFAGLVNILVIWIVAWIVVIIAGMDFGRSGDFSYTGDAGAKEPVGVINKSDGDPSCMSRWIFSKSFALQNDLVIIGECYGP